MNKMLFTTIPRNTSFGRWMCPYLNALFAYSVTHYWCIDRGKDWPCVLDSGEGMRWPRLTSEFLTNKRVKGLLLSNGAVRTGMQKISWSKQKHSLCNAYKNYIYLVSRKFRDLKTSEKYLENYYYFPPFIIISLFHSRLISAVLCRESRWVYYWRRAD